MHVTPRRAHRAHVGLSLLHRTFELAQSVQLSLSLRGVCVLGWSTEGRTAVPSIATGSVKAHGLWNTAKRPGVPWRLSQGTIYIP